jgi:WD40 repeat protein
MVAWVALLACIAQRPGGIFRGESGLGDNPLNAHILRTKPGHGSRWGRSLWVVCGFGSYCPEQPDYKVIPVVTRLVGEPPTGRQSVGGEYDAFISYSHAADGTLAPAVQQGLEMLAKPIYQRRALRVFRDQTSLAVTPALWPEIQQALQASRYFILLASPTAARSPWVDQELAWWMRHREPETLLIVLTAGSIVWDQANSDFEWRSTDALPRQLSGWFREEPLWVDLRWAREASRLSHRDPRLQDNVATLAAPLRGIPKDDLVGRDIVLHRRTVRLTQAAVALLVLLALGATTGGLVALSQRNAARRETVLAESRALASAAQSTASTELDVSLLLAQQAARMHPSSETRAAMLTAVTASPHLVRFLPQRSNVSALADLPNGGMAVGHTDGSVSLLEADYQNERTLGGTGKAPVTALAVSAPSQLLAAADQQGNLRFWSIRSQTPRRQWSARPGDPTLVAIAPDGHTVAVVTKSGTLVVLDGRDGTVRGETSLGLGGTVVENLVFLDDQRVLVGDEVGDAQVWAVTAGLRRLSQHGQLSLGDQLLAHAWSPDGRTYAVAESTETAPVFDAVTGRPRGADFTSVPPTVGPMAVNDGGDRAAFLYAGLLSVFDRSPEAAAAGRARVDLPGFSRAELLMFSRDGNWLLAAAGATIAVFDLEQQARLATVLPTELGPLPCQACRASLAVDPLGRSVVWTDGPRVVCWDLRSDRLGSVVYSPDTAWSAAFTTDGSMLVVSTDEGLEVAPTPAGCPTAEPVLRARSGAFSQRLWPLGGMRVLAWDGASMPRLVDLHLGREIRSYQAKLGSSEYLGDMAVSSDDQTFAVTVSTGDILWYNVKTGARIGVVHTNTGSPGALAFVPGSQRVARTTATTVQLWDPGGRLVGQFDGSAQRLLFSADGQLLFGLDNEEVLRVWDVASRSQIGTLQALPLVDDRGNQTAGGAEYGLRTAMGSGPDGTLWFVAASARPTGWTFSLPTWNRLACTWAGRSLSPEEWLHYVGTTPPTDLSCRR